MAGSERASIWRHRAETQYNDTQQRGKVQWHYLRVEIRNGSKAHEVQNV